MRNHRQVLTAIILCGLLVACGKSNTQNTQTAPKISKITFRISSGVLAPALAWDEIYFISKTGLIFERLAYADVSMVNAGVWQVNGYGANEVKLYDELAGPGVYNVAITGKGLTPAGGEIRDYALLYDDGSARDIVIGDGSIYTNSDLISKPVASYISAVVLPAAAVSRYK